MCGTIDGTPERLYVFRHVGYLVRVLLNSTSYFSGKRDLRLEGVANYGNGKNTPHGMCELAPIVYFVFPPSPV